MKGLIIKYTIISLPVGLLLTPITENTSLAGYWASVVLTIVGIVITGFFLHELALLITGNGSCSDTKKKYAVNIGIVTGQIAVSLLLAALFQESQLLDIVVLNVIFITVGVMLTRAARKVDESQAALGCLFYLLILAVIVFIIIINVLFIML